MAGIVRIGVAMLLSLGLAACGESDDNSGPSATTQDIATTTTTSSTTTTTEPPPETVATTPRTVETAPPAQASMPNVPCGTDLQTAQDMVQDAGVFYSRSEDATGRGRNQVLDSNWVVVGQEPAAGAPIEEGDPVFYVVKQSEFSGDCL